jgi:peptide deformylase
MKLTNRILHRDGKACEFQWPWQNQRLCNDMLALMRKERGIGLAALQVGIKRRLFVMEVNSKVRCCFNPEIIDLSEHADFFAEGCLSFPGDSCNIRRPDEISVRYQDHDGAWIYDKLHGLEARCFQHELDHLDGITMWDRYREQNAKQSRN